MNYYLAIDQGTHASRAILYDGKGNLIASETKAIKLSRLDVEFEKEFIEQDPLEILDSVKLVLDKLLASIPEKIHKQIASCGIACQRSTIVACNHQGEPLSPAISWQDTRGENYLDNLPLSEKQIQATSGLPLSAHYAASKMRWLLDNHPVVSSTPSEELYLAPLISFLLLNLLSPKQFVVDHSQAQRTQLLDIKTLNWSQELLNAFEIPLTTLTRLKPMCDHYGYLNDTTIPVTAVCGDQNAAIFGSGIKSGMGDEKNALVNLGSGAFVLRMLPTLQHSKASQRLLSGIAYTSSQQTRYCREGTVNGSGNALHWFQQQLDQAPSVATESPTEATKNWREQLPLWLAESNDPSNSPAVFINTVGGLGSPWWFSHIEPHFYDDNSMDNKADKTSGTIAAQSVAVIESILFLIQDNLKLMTREHPISLLTLSGGLSQLDGLCQKMANLSQIPVQRLVDKETTARGVAWLASGKKDIWEASSDTTFEPEDDPYLLERYELFQSRLSSLLSASKVSSEGTRS